MVCQRKICRIEGFSCRSRFASRASRAKMSASASARSLPPGRACARASASSASHVSAPVEGKCLNAELDFEVIARRQRRRHEKVQNLRGRGLLPRRDFLQNRERARDFSNTSPIIRTRPQLSSEESRPAPLQALAPSVLRCGTPPGSFSSNS